MAREDYGKPLFVCGCFCRSAFLIRDRPVSIVGPQMFSCRSQRGEFCEPPQGGASARTAERRCLSLQAAVAPNIFSLHPFRVAASCILQSAAEFANNSVVCHSEEHSDEESVSSIRRQILDCTSLVFLLLAWHSPQAAFGSQGKKILRLRSE